MFKFPMSNRKFVKLAKEYILSNLPSYTNRKLTNRQADNALFNLSYIDSFPNQIFWLKDTIKELKKTLKEKEKEIEELKKPRD